jgi:hypothetical protein
MQIRSLLVKFSLLFPTLAAAWGQVSVEIGNQTVSTKSPTIRIHGMARGVAGIQRVEWDSDRELGGLATIHGTRAALSIRWETEPIPLHAGRNRVKVRAVDASNQAATEFATIDYFPENPAPPAQSELRQSIYRGKPVTYQVRNGMAIFQGDILLGPADEIDAPTSRLKPRSSTLANTSGLWPAVSGVVHIPYTGTTNSNITSAIASFNTTFSGIIQWVPRTSEANYANWNLNASDHSGSCEAFVGMVGGKQDMTGSIDCVVSTLLHEMGHVSGLWHEQSRMDRNSYVNVISANIDKPQASNFDQVLVNELDQGLYDYASIMHYGATLFGKFGLAPTLESIPAGIPLSNNTGYTTSDVEAIKRLCGHPSTSVTIDSNPSGAQVIVDGSTITTPKTFNWSLNSSHTLDLPSDPQTIGGQLHIFGRWNNQGGTTRTNSITITPGNNTVYSPGTVPLNPVYVANFIPIYQYSLSANTTNGTAVATPAPSLTFNGKNYYTNRQLIALTATPNSGFGFFEWFNISLFNLYANPNNLYVANDLTNTQPLFKPAPILTVNTTAPLFPSVGAFPPIAINVDGSSIFPPQNFTWTSSHTLDGTPLNPSPVTTNISYAYGSWSDGMAEVHSVSPAASNQTVTATYTPTYRAIVLPNPFCGGTVGPNTDQNNLNGAMVNYTATPASGFSFVGWSGDFSGTSTSFPVTVHDEIVATANFNLSGLTAPLAISSISPSSTGAGAGAPTLSITGTGFGPSTFGFWNNSFRTVTYHSSTFVTMQLNAGDVVTPGYYNVQLDNNPGSCQFYVNSSYPVTITSAPPSLSISKIHSGNFTQGQAGSYTVTVTNAVGAGSTSGTVTMTEMPPAGMSITSMSGTNWTCPSGGLTCTNTTTLPGGVSYLPITVNVSIAGNAAPSLTNMVQVSGGAAATAGNSDMTTIMPAATQLKITTQPTGGTVNTPLSTVTVQVQDAGGNLVTSSNAAVTLTSSPAGINTMASAVNGVATFSNLMLSAPGPYTLTASATGLTPSMSNSFTISAGVVPPSVTIESPASGAVISSGTVIVTGWALDNTSSSGTAIANVQVKVDGTFIGNASYGTSRPDICATYPGRPGCPNVGFIYSVSTGLLSPGTHTISVSATDSDGPGDVGTTSVNITVAPLVMTSTKIGVFRNGSQFLLDSNGDGTPDAPDRFLTTFAPPSGVMSGDIGIVGDWNGDGHAKAGYYRPSTGQWFLDMNNSGVYDAGDVTYGFGGVTGDVPMVGNWSGVMGVSGPKDCIGVFRSGFFWVLDLNCNGSFDGTPADAAFPFGGLSGDVPVVGKFAGGFTRVGVVRKYAPMGVPQGEPFFWVLDGGDPGGGGSPAAHQPDIPRCFAFGGIAGDQYVVGDWLGIGSDRGGVYRSGLWVLDANGLHNPDLTLSFGGVATDKPVTGKW